MSESIIEKGQTKEVRQPVEAVLMGKEFRPMPEMKGKGHETSPASEGKKEKKESKPIFDFETPGKIVSRTSLGVARSMVFGGLIVLAFLLGMSAIGAAGMAVVGGIATFLHFGGGLVASYMSLWSSHPVLMGIWHALFAIGGVLHGKKVVKEAAKEVREKWDGVTAD